MRQQHYRFAHQVLMEAVLRDPNAWLAEAEARGGAVLQGPWEAAGQGLAGPDLVEGPGPSLAVVAPAPGVTAAVVTLPPPQAPTECHFVAVVCAGGAPPRYFVAERGIEGEGGASRAYTLTGGKPGTSEQVADLIYFLCSDASSHITGTEMWIDGGQSLLQG